MNERIQISGSLCEVVSFALQQNHVPVIRQLTISNLSDSEIQNVKVVITTDPSLSDEWTAEIASLMIQR